jgi:hypothetical protein
MLKHATISAWQRDHEEGGYRAEIRGHTLHVRWVPERPGQRRGFTWEVADPSGGKVTSTGLYEEIEIAMADAEQRVAPDTEKREGKTVD